MIFDFVYLNKSIFTYYNIIIFNISYYNNNNSMSIETNYIILYTLLINNNIIKANIYINKIKYILFLLYYILKNKYNIIL